jgi:hypothetical protein
MAEIQEILTRADFEEILETYAGRQLTHIPVTKTTSNYTGEETLTEGTPVLIKCYVMKTGQTWNYREYGLVEKGDMIGLFKIVDNVKLDSIIIVDNERFRVREHYNVPGVFDSTGNASVYAYTVASLFKAE